MTSAYFWSFLMGNDAKDTRNLDILWKQFGMDFWQKIQTMLEKTW